MSNVCHLIGFIMHQPAGNLLELIHRDTWNATQIMLAYNRPLKYAALYPNEARFCVCFSGILLEQLQQEEVVRCYKDILNIPKMLEGYHETPNIDLVGTGYYHPVYPLIPEADWDEQIARGRDKIREVFRREPEIFWPPEMGFSCNMIPNLVNHGYKYVICDGIHIQPDKNLSPGEIIYQPHIAEYNGKNIILIPRDGQLSLAQQSGTEPEFVNDEIRRKTDGIDFPALVTTWTDGENGSWFLQMHEEAGFWGRFFEPYVKMIRKNQIDIKLLSLADFIHINPPTSRALVERGSWVYYVIRSDAHFLLKWAGLPEQRKALEELINVSNFYQEITQKLTDVIEPYIQKKLQEAYEHILRAEASDNFYWKGDWLFKVYRELDVAKELLKEIITTQRLNVEFE